MATVGFGFSVSHGGEIEFLALDPARIEPLRLPKTFGQPNGIMEDLFFFSLYFNVFLEEELEWIIERGPVLHLNLCLIGCMVYLVTSNIVRFPFQITGGQLIVLIQIT